MSEIKPDDFTDWYNRGIALSELDRNEESIISADRVLKVRPNNYQAWYNRDDALGELGRYEEKIAAYDRA